jgi:hypothetical protein
MEFMAHVRYGLYFNDYTAIDSIKIYPFDPLEDIVKAIDEMKDEGFLKHAANQNMILINKYREDNQVLLKHLNDIKIEYQSLDHKNNLLKDEIESLKNRNNNTLKKPEYSIVSQTKNNSTSSAYSNKRKKLQDGNELDTLQEIPTSVNFNLIIHMKNNPSKEHITMFITNLLLSHRKYLLPMKNDHNSFYSCLDEQLEITFPNDSRSILTACCESLQNDNHFLSTLYGGENSPDCWSDKFQVELKELRNLNWTNISTKLFNVLCSIYQFNIVVFKFENFQLTKGNAYKEYDSSLHDFYQKNSKVIITYTYEQQLMYRAFIPMEVDSESFSQNNSIHESSIYK